MEINKYASPVVAAFIKKNDKYLVVFEPRFNNNGIWRVPGGRLEYGETVEEALIREMKEELNVDININRYLGFGQDHVIIRKKLKASRLIHYFECEIVNGEPEIMEDEASEIKWVTLNEMKKLEPLEGSIIDMFKRFKTDLEVKQND